MATYVVFEVTGTMKEKEASEQMAVVVLKRLGQAVDGANVECCKVQEVTTPRAFERLIQISKGSA